MWLNHDRARTYLRGNPEYSTEGGRTNKILYTKFVVYELGNTAPTALKNIRNQVIGERDEHDENLYKRGEKEVRPHLEVGLQEMPRYMGIVPCRGECSWIILPPGP